MNTNRIPAPDEALEAARAVLESHILGWVSVLPDQCDLDDLVNLRDLGRVLARIGRVGDPVKDGRGLAGLDSAMLGELTAAAEEEAEFWIKWAPSADEMPDGYRPLRSTEAAALKRSLDARDVLAALGARQREE